jgi:hypothetical protein
MSDASEAYISVKQAAAALGITPQAVRDKVKKGEIRARTDARAWSVRGDDVQRLVRSSAKHSRPAKRPGSARPGVEAAGSQERLRQLEEELTTIGAERDRFRADASAARESALAMSGAAADLVEATKLLTSALEGQISAVVQLLTPGSPAELPISSASGERD